MFFPGRFSQSSGDFFNGKLKMENGEWKIIEAARADLNCIADLIRDLLRRNTDEIPGQARNEVEINNRRRQWEMR